MKRNPHPDLVREHLARWRKRLTRALNEVVKLERALARAEKRQPPPARQKRTKTDKSAVVLPAGWRP